MSDYKLTRDAAGKVTSQYDKMLRSLNDDDLCPSCREPINSPSGDGCAAMTMHQPVKETPKIDWKAALEAEHASLPKRLERVALLAETANYWTDEHRLMPAAGVADILYEALDEIKRHRAVNPHHPRRPERTR